MSSSQTTRKSESTNNRDQSEVRPWDDLVVCVRDYVRKEPEVAACICLGIGFILGWKLKPW